MKTFMLSLVFLVGVSFSGTAKESNQVSTKNNKTVQVNAENSKKTNHFIKKDCDAIRAGVFNVYFANGYSRWRAGQIADSAWLDCLDNGGHTDHKVIKHP